MCNSGWRRGLSLRVFATSTVPRYYVNKNVDKTLILLIILELNQNWKYLSKFCRLYCFPAIQTRDAPKKTDTDWPLEPWTQNRILP